MKMSFLRISLLIVICLFSSKQLLAQCSVPLKYAPVNIKYFPVKKIRITVHVIQKQDGTGNISNNDTGIQYIHQVIDTVNKYMRSPKYLKGNLSTVDITDTRIEYVLQNIYFHTNSFLYNMNYNDNTIYNFDSCVLNNTNMPDFEKYNSLHVYFNATSNVAGDGYCTHWLPTTDIVLRHSQENYKGNQWHILVYDHPAAVIRHELAHMVGHFYDIVYTDTNDHYPYPSAGPYDGFCGDYDARSDHYVWDSFTNDIMVYSTWQDAFSECQAGRMYYNTFEYPELQQFIVQDWCTYNSQYSITVENGENVVIESPRYFLGDITIYSGGTLTIKCKIHMPQNGKIVVQPGGKLIIDGGYITNLCGNMWQGIVVLGDKTKRQFLYNQGYVKLMNDAVIENAKIGISVGTNANDGNQNGGVVNAEDKDIGTQYSCTFKNCDIAVLIYKYKNISAGFNFCVFDHCHFLANAPLVDTIRYHGLSSSFFVKLEDVDGVRFYGNTFENATNLNAFRPVGIQCIDATFSVQKGFTINDFNQPCLPTGDSNYFKNLRFGIEILSTRGLRKVRILESTFEDCTMGIKNRCDENTKIYHNTFKYTSNHQKDGIEPGNKAIASVASDKIDIDKNIFSWNITSNQKAKGIETDVYPNFIQNYSNLYQNTFSNLNGNKNIYANNIIGNQSNIKINCNTFNQTTNDLFIWNHICDQYATFSPLKEAGNNFHSWSSGSSTIVNLGIDTLHYYTTSNKAPQPGSFQNVKVETVGVISNACASHNPCDYYDCICLTDIDTSLIPFVDSTDNICKIIFDKIYTADFASADSMILTLNPTSEANKIQLLNLVYDVFYDGRNYWHLTESDSNELTVLASNNDEASYYAQNILTFYKDVYFSVDTPTTLTCFKSAKNVSCNAGNDGAISTAIIGGVPPFSYSWSNSDTTMGISGLTAGTYILTVTDSTGFYIRDTTIITQPPILSIAHITIDESCYGSSDGAIELTVSGGVPPYSYLWSNNDTTENITELTPGTYQVIVTDQNNCTVYDNATISTDLFYVNIITGEYPNDLIALVNNELDENYVYAYFWTTNDTTNTIIGVPRGYNYGVTVTTRNEYNCSANDEIFVTEESKVILSTGRLNDISFKIYPNPFKEELIISLLNNSVNTESYTIVINNIFGKNVLTENIMLIQGDEKLKNLNLEYLSTGSYILSLTKNNNLVIRKKIIKI